VLTVGPGVWSATLEQFQRCGRGRAECVVYWLARLEAPDVVDTVVHPDHTATAGMYSVKSDWLTPFFIRLHSERRTVRVQVHTHCYEAFHSVTDDAWPLVTTPGFLSLVLPEFARGPLHHDDFFLVELDPSGEWNRIDVRENVGELP
jgi:hypothetical protein